MSAETTGPDPQSTGASRWLARLSFVLAGLAIVILVVFAGLASLAMLAVALVADQEDWRMPEHPAQPPARHPYLIMNPRSGDGKVGKFDLKRKAEALGAEVFLLEGAAHIDVAGVARKAVTEGADLLGVAGGDGTQALVAGIAAEHGLPFIVISAGTRNQLSLDLGLEREDPPASL